MKEVDSFTDTHSAPLWTHPEEFGEREQQVRKIMNAYPEDALIISLKMPDVYKAPTEFPEYRWLNREIEEVKKTPGWMRVLRSGIGMNWMIF